MAASAKARGVASKVREGVVVSKAPPTPKAHLPVSKSSLYARATVKPEPRPVSKSPTSSSSGKSAQPKVHLASRTASPQKAGPPAPTPPSMATVYSLPPGKFLPKGISSRFEKAPIETSRLRQVIEGVISSATPPATRSTTAEAEAGPAPTPTSITPTSSGTASSTSSSGRSSGPRAGRSSGVVASKPTITHPPLVTRGERVSFDEDTSLSSSAQERKPSGLIGWLWPRNKPLYKRPALYIFGAVVVFAMMQQTDEPKKTEE